MRFAGGPRRSPRPGIALDKGGGCAQPPFARLRASAAPVMDRPSSPPRRPHTGRQRSRRGPQEERRSKGYQAFARPAQSRASKMLWHQQSSVINHPTYTNAPCFGLRGRKRFGSRAKKCMVHVKGLSNSLRQRPIWWLISKISSEPEMAQGKSGPVRASAWL